VCVKQLVKFQGLGRFPPSCHLAPRSSNHNCHP